MSLMAAFYGTQCTNLRHTLSVCHTGESRLNG